MARSPLIHVLRRAYQTIHLANQPPFDRAEVNDWMREPSWSRRQFLQRSVVAAGALGVSLGTPPSTAQRTVQSPADPRILIVGAGVAGLTVAYRLQQWGASVDVVDAASRIGGRLRTLSNWPGCPNPVELGGEFIDTRHAAVWRLAQDLGLELADLRAADRGLEPEIFYFQGQRISHDAIAHAFTPLAQQIQQDLAAIGTPPPTYRTANPAARHLDRLSLAEYLDALDLDPVIKQLVEVAYVTEYGRDSDAQTCLNMLFLIGHEAEQWRTYGDSDERWHIVGGNEQLPKTLAQAVQSSIRLDTRLESIRERGDRTYQVSLRHGNTSREATYDIVVLAMPFSVLRSVELAVEMPQPKQQAIAHLGYGTSSKLAVPLRQRIWRTRYGSTLSIYTDQPFQNTWESARYTPGSSGWITNLRGGSAGMALGSGNPQHHASTLLQSLDALFPGITTVQTGQPLRAFWAGDPNTLGSYACYQPGQWTAFGGVEAEPVGNLWFAGEHCSLDSQGYINGAIESAEQVAQALQSLLTPQRTML